MLHNSVYHIVSSQTLCTSEGKKITNQRGRERFNNNAGKIGKQSNLTLTSCATPTQRTKNDNIKKGSLKTNRRI